MKQTDVDYTTRRATKDGKYRVCPKCGKVGSYEPRQYRDRTVQDRKVYFSLAYYVHKASLIDICGIGMRSLDECCSVKEDSPAVIAPGSQAQM